MPRKPGEEIIKAKQAKRYNYQREQKHVADREYNKHRPIRHKFYSTSRWRQLRDYIMRKQPLCQECLKNGVIKKGDVVDHITPIEKGGSPTAEKNLQVLCHACHNKKHADERRGHLERMKNPS